MKVTRQSPLGCWVSFVFVTCFPSVRTHPHLRVDLDIRQLIYSSRRRSHFVSFPNYESLLLALARRSLTISYSKDYVPDQSKTLSRRLPSRLQISVTHSRSTVDSESDRPSKAVSCRPISKFGYPSFSNHQPKPHSRSVKDTFFYLPWRYIVE